MHKKVSTPEAYEDCIRAICTPNTTATDIIQVLTGTKWTNINRRYCIVTGINEPTHEHQNYCEKVGGNFKFAVLKLFHTIPHAPSSYWCYIARFLDKTCH